MFCNNLRYLESFQANFDMLFFVYWLKEEIILGNCVLEEVIVLKGVIFPKHLPFYVRGKDGRWNEWQVIGLPSRFAWIHLPF